MYTSFSLVFTLHKKDGNKILASHGVFIKYLCMCTKVETDIDVFTLETN